MLAGATRKQREILAYIQAYIGQNSYSPSYREIQKHFGFSSLGSVSKHVTRLRDRGLLSLSKYCSRSLRVAQEGDTVLLPLMGTIRAGRPIEAISHAEPTAVPSSLVPSQGDYYLLRVAGDSMRDAQIAEGDLVIIESRPVAEPGQIVVALINGTEATLKRYYQKGDRVLLEAAHPGYATLDLPADSVTIQGIVRGLLRKY